MLILGTTTFVKAEGDEKAVAAQGAYTDEGYAVGQDAMMDAGAEMMNGTEENMMEGMEENMNAMEENMNAMMEDNAGMNDGMMKESGY